MKEQVSILKIKSLFSLRNTLEIENQLIRFHNEIIDFYEYIKPSE